MARVYVGNLPSDVREKELDDLFYKYGRINDIQIKFPTRPPAFAFITFDDYRDAEDAVRGRDGYSFAGARIRVELAKNDRRGRDEPRSERGSGRPKKTPNFGVIVSDLPRSASWQDLKDFGRKAGDVAHSDVDSRTGEGILDYSNKADMDNAVRILHDSEFKNRFDQGRVSVRYFDEAAGGKADRERSRSRDRGRSASHSRSRSRSPKRRSPSPR